MGLLLSKVGMDLGPAPHPLGSAPRSGRPSVSMLRLPPARPPRDVGRERGRESEERDPLGLSSSRRAGHVPLSSALTTIATPSSGTYNFILLVTLTRELSLHL